MTDVQDVGSDCIVVGSHGTSGIRRFLLGSVSDYVLQYAPCSVLIVKKHDQHCAETGKPLSMLLSYDDSASARKAVEFCASLPLDEQAKVTALTVLPLVRNLENPSYMRIVLSGKASLEEVFAEVDIATFRDAFRESQDVPEKIPSKLKPLIAMPDFPEKLLSMAEKAAPRRKSNRILRQ